MRGTLLLLAAAVACSREKAGNASASAYTSDSDSTARAAGISGTNSGVEMEAPRLIPAMQNQLSLMGTGAQRIDPDNLTAYKNLASDLVNSMIADLYRAGYADSGSFRILRDSVLNDLGGGAGASTKLDPSALKPHIERMRRLISMYQQAMRRAGEKQ
jgi:hypothetical protein